MVRKYAQFNGIDNDRKITNEADNTFFYHLQKGLLLALRERGTINAMQYRQAQENLSRQRRERAQQKGPDR